MTCFLFLRSCLSCFCCFLGVTSVLQADGANSASASFCSAYTIKMNLVTNTGSFQEFQQIVKKGSPIQLCLTRTDCKDLWNFTVIKSKCYLTGAHITLLIFCMLINGHINSGHIPPTFNHATPVSTAGWQEEACHNKWCKGQCTFNEQD